MSLNKNNERKKWMREFDLPMLCQGIQPHTQLLEKISDYVADIYQDNISTEDNFESTTVYYKEPSNPEIKVNVKPPLLDTEIISKVSEKESAYFIALDDHMAIISDLSMQQAGSNLELQAFDTKYQRRLQVSSIAEQFCGAGVTDEDFTKLNLKTDKEKRAFSRHLEVCMTDVDSVKSALSRHRSLSSMGLPEGGVPMSKDIYDLYDPNKLEETAISIVWENDEKIIGTEYNENTQQFKQKYPMFNKQWLADHYKNWDKNEKSRRQLANYTNTVNYLEHLDERPIIIERIESAAKDLANYLTFVGNTPYKMHLDPCDKEQCALLTVNFSAVLEQLCSLSEYGKKWYGDDIESKTNLLTLIPYNFNKDWAKSFESMMAYYLENKELERGENGTSFDYQSIVSKVIATGNTINAGIEAKNAIKEYWQQRMQSAIPQDRITQSPMFKELPPEQQNTFFTQQETLGSSNKAWQSWQQAGYYRTITMTQITVKVEVYTAVQVIQTVTLEAKTELIPVIFTDPDYEKNLADWEAKNASLKKDIARITSNRNRLNKQINKSAYNRRQELIGERNELNAQLRKLNNQLQASLEAIPQRIKVTAYAVRNFVNISVEEMLVRVRYLFVTSFELTEYTIKQWVGPKGFSLYNELKPLGPLQARQKIPTPPINNKPPVRSPTVHTTTVTGNKSIGALDDAAERAGIGPIGWALIGFNVINCVSTIKQAAKQDSISASDIQNIAIAHAYLGSLLLGFQVSPLWRQVGKVIVDLPIVEGKEAVGSKLLITLSTQEWKTLGDEGFEVAAKRFTLYAKGFAFLSFIASGLESWQIFFSIDSATSTGEKNARRVKLLGTVMMTVIAGAQIVALFGASAWMSFAFGPAGVAITFVAAIIYMIGSFLESYFHRDGIDLWLHNSIWGDNPKYWEESDIGHKEEQRALQEIFMKPSVYTIPRIGMSGMGYERLYAISLYAIMPPQLANTEVAVHALFTQAPLVTNFWGFIDDTPLTKYYDIEYEELGENSNFTDLATLQQELNQALGTNDTAPNDSEMIVWETSFMYDDSTRSDCVTGVELMITYPDGVLSERKDKRGYRFKLNDINLATVIQGELTENTMESTQSPPSGKNTLLIDSNLTLAKGFTIYPELNNTKAEE